MTVDRRLAPHTHHLRIQRTARYYTVGGLDAGETPGPRTVWFVLHGYGQLASQFVRYFATLDDGKSVIVAPEALNRFYLVSPESGPARERPVGATWMTREDRDCEITDYVEYLDALRDQVAGSDAGISVRILGFSQGCATATRWVTSGRVSASSLVLWGGLMPPETDMTRAAEALRGVRITFVLGSRDHYVNEEMLAAEHARLDAAGIAHDTIRFDGGHAIKRTALEELVARLGV